MKILTAKRVRATSYLLLVVSYCHILGAQSASQGTPAVNQDGVVVGTFEDHVKEYMRLHNKAKGGIPKIKPTDSAHQINQHQRQLADNIRAERPAARQGDIFTPEVSQLFKRLIATAFQGSDATRIRASLHHAEPVNNISLQINAAYPEPLPLQSTPPSVLLNLPPLPPELDYRIVGRDLVLRDVGADIIVDFIANAIPSS